MSSKSNHCSVYKHTDTFANDVIQEALWWNIERTWTQIKSKRNKKNCQLTPSTPDTFKPSKFTAVSSGIFQDTERRKLEYMTEVGWGEVRQVFLLADERRYTTLRFHWLTELTPKVRWHTLSSDRRDRFGVEIKGGGMYRCCCVHASATNGFAFLKRGKNKALVECKSSTQLLVSND